MKTETARDHSAAAVRSVFRVACSQIEKFSFRKKLHRDEALTRGYPCPSIEMPLTSIYWVPTLKSLELALAHNKFDHAHYDQGGGPFSITCVVPALELQDLRSSDPTSAMVISSNFLKMEMWGDPL